jgi:hypothetical protein
MKLVPTCPEARRSHGYRFSSNAIRRDDVPRAGTVRTRGAHLPDPRTPPARRARLDGGWASASGRAWTRRWGLASRWRVIDYRAARTRRRLSPPSPPGCTWCHARTLRDPRAAPRGEPPSWRTFPRALPRLRRRRGRGRMRWTSLRLCASGKRRVVGACASHAKRVRAHYAHDLAGARMRAPGRRYAAASRCSARPSQLVSPVMRNSSRTGPRALHTVSCPPSSHN